MGNAKMLHQLGVLKQRCTNSVLSYIIPSSDNCLEVYSVFSLLPTSSQKTAACSSKHPLEGWDQFCHFYLPYNSSNEEKKSLVSWLRTFNFYAYPNKSSTSQNITFQKQPKQNHTPQLNPSWGIVALWSVFLAEFQLLFAWFQSLTQAKSWIVGMSFKMFCVSLGREWNMAHTFICAALLSSLIR